VESSRTSPTASLTATVAGTSSAWIISHRAMRSTLRSTAGIRARLESREYRASTSSRSSRCATTPRTMTSVYGFGCPCPSATAPVSRSTGLSPRSSAA